MYIVIDLIIIAYLQSYTALHEAVQHNRLNIVQLLVELGADIIATDNVSDYSTTCVACRCHSVYCTVHLKSLQYHTCLGVLPGNHAAMLHLSHSNMAN